jgi:ribosomal protein S18 acetylase RimI-like enzyme
MEIGRFCHDDVAQFLSLADAEGWLCEQREFDFLLRVFPQGCFSCRVAGVLAGFITSVKYAESGWIGNLLVRAELRGRGIGAVLMAKALATLGHAGAATIWLTASAAGAALYRKLGFTEIDTVQRWVGQGGGSGKIPGGDGSLAAVVAMDCAGWGDRRDLLIADSLQVGSVVADTQGFLVSQRWSAGTQVGPWGGSCPLGAAKLLDACRSQAGAGERIFLDVPAGNAAAGALLTSRNFALRGATALMYRGTPPAYEPGRIFALASMGSYG